MTNTLTDSPLNVYRSYLEQGKLAYQYSPSADRAVFFPRVICPFTGSGNLEWRISSGRGVIHAITAISPKNAETYYVALIDMDEGFRLMSNVIPAPGQEPAIGMRVEATIARLGEDNAPSPIFHLQDRHGQ